MRSPRVDPSTPRRPPGDEEPEHDPFRGKLAATPWYLTSLLLHLWLVLILFAIPWMELAPDRPDPVVAARAGLVEYVDDEPAEPNDPVEAELDPFSDLDVVEPVEDPWIEDLEIEQEPIELVGTSDSTDEAPFDENAFSSWTGVAGDPGGKFGRRRRGAASYGGSSGMASALSDGLEWLARHQSEDGSWDCDRFMRHGHDGHCACTDGGQAAHDVGVTGLALLAFLGAGNTTAEGPYRETVARGIAWLRSQQQESGLFGSQRGFSYLYSHALATMAVCEAYHANRSPLLRRPATEAVHFIQRARNPYSAWRYHAPPRGDNDTSVTGWMVFALATAADAGLEIDPGAFDGALAWLESVTNEETGRVGYTSQGSMSHGGRSESMTAVGLLSRLLIADARRLDLEDQRLTNRQVDLLLRRLPVWGGDRELRDMYYWYYGTYAMFQVGGSDWQRWERALEEAVVDSQRTDGHHRGSWDPEGPWGDHGGRVYSTALMTLCLEVYFRYDRLLGTR